MGRVDGFDERSAFSGFGAPSIPMLIASLILAKPMDLTELVRRFALSIMGWHWATKSPR
jgi:hypothetical protein